MPAAGGEIVIIGHEVHLVGPVIVVERVLRRAHHEIGGERNIRRHFGQHVAFGAEELLERVRAEVLEIEQAPRVGEVAFAAHITRRQDLLEGVESLGPEVRSPRGVHLVDCAVPVAAPLPEGLHGVIRVVEVVMAAVFVAYVP